MTDRPMYTKPTWKTYEDPAEQWQEFKRQASALPIYELRGHMQVGRMCGCGKCFCCAARENYNERMAYLRTEKEAE